MPSQHTITITVTEEQARTIATACEILARLGIGQFRDALDKLPRPEAFQTVWHEGLDAIGEILSQYMVGNVSGGSSSLGILHPNVSDEARQAWDIYQCVRYRFVRDRGIVLGKPTGTPRTWAGRLVSAYFDEPLKSSTQPLPEVTSSRQARGA